MDISLFFYPLIYKKRLRQKCVKKYFRYVNTRYGDRAKRQYEEKMYNTFGSYINPYRWKDINSEVTIKQIKKVIIQEIDEIAKDKLYGLPTNLNAKQFFMNDKIISKIVEKLDAQGIIIPLDYDYSYKQFKNYYTISIKLKI